MESWKFFRNFLNRCVMLSPQKSHRLEILKMQQRVVGSLLCLLMLIVPASAASAQGAPAAYGMSVGLDNAKKVANAAIAEARKNMLTMAIAVVDTAGNLVYFEK